ncbi:DUF2065 domain-containing protein [Algicella marina]|uniref:DUF2065 domain-containing protein n=1 Tax=Algicella marina TaxID=2683284 RepID=UPI0024E0222C|nr:DUF2065 domain-containing protein [Algicella marina]
MLSPHRVTIEDVIFGVAFVAIVEGLVLALAPFRIGDILRKLDEIPLDTRRLIGLGVAAVGVSIVWFLRG